MAPSDATERAASGPAPAEPAPNRGIRIHKLLSRGQGDDAQVLLALVSSPIGTARDDDVWVAIGRKAAEPVWAEGSWEGIEVARPVTQTELEALDLDWPSEKPEPPFGIADDPERGVWLARFDFSDHPSLQDRWRGFVRSGDKPAPEKLDVVAWRSRLERGLDPKGVEKARFQPLPDLSAHVALGYDDIIVQPPCELGVLFVHGIGDHAVRETLVLWSEKIVGFWCDFALAVNARGRATVADDERYRVRRWAESHQLRNRIPLDGISQSISDFAASSNEVRDAQAARPLAPPFTAEPAICCAAVRTEDTIFPDLNPGQPSATLVRFSSVDTQAVLRESHVLFSEAYWTRESFPPTFRELAVWLTTAIPIAVWARIHRLVSTRPSEIMASDKKPTDGFERFRVAVSILVWLVQLAVLPGLYVVAALVSQIVIATVSLVGLLPIPWVRVATRSVITTLMGTVGQSFALQTSPIRRSAIVSVVRKNLDWLYARCHRVVVLSHSQGAEISRHVFLDGRRDNVARWYTAGAGIAPLSMLDPENLKKPASRVVVWFSTFALTLATALLCFILLHLIPGLELGSLAVLAEAARGFGWQGFFLSYCTFLVVVFLGSQGGPTVRPQLRVSLLGKWRDLYASEDPVAGGSLVARFKDELSQLGLPVPTDERIFNTRFPFFDHTGYFRNIEQFVAPIAVDLLHMLGMRFDGLGEEEALRHAKRRRDLRTWWNALVSTLALLACAAAFAWVTFGLSRGALWIEQARTARSQGADTWDRLGAWWSGGGAGQVVGDLWLPIVILVALGVWLEVVHFLLARCSAKRLVRDLAAAARTPPGSAAGAVERR